MSSSAVPIPAKQKVSIRTFATFGVKKSGNVGLCLYSSPQGKEVLAILCMIFAHSMLCFMQFEDHSLMKNY